MKPRKISRYVVRTNLDIPSYKRFKVTRKGKTWNSVSLASINRLANVLEQYPTIDFDIWVWK